MKPADRLGALPGATGTGKTLSRARSAIRPCRRGDRAYYRRASRLFDDLRLARADGSHGRLLSKLARIDGISSLTEGSRSSRTRTAAICSEILEDWYGSRSAIVTILWNHL